MGYHRDMLEYIYRRRSIRKYHPDRPVEPEKVTELLRAAMAAPSANNRQGWRFIVVDDRETLDKLAERYPNASMLKTATLCIVPVADMETFYYHQDLAAATENLLLAAPGLGLGTCWCGMKPERQEWAHEFFEVPDGWWVFALIAVGYPAEDKPANTWYKEENVFHGKWGIRQQ